MRRLVPLDETVVIEKMVPGGDGMGRLSDGRLVFAERAFVGDELRLRTVEDRKSFVFARNFEVKTPSPNRRAPACPDCEPCGGCDWMWIDEAEQRRAKADLIAQALTRTGRVAFPEPVLVHPAPRSLRYRSRVRLQVKEGKVGFFARGSHELVEVSDCLVSSEEVWWLVERVRDLVHQRPSAFVEVAHVEVRVFDGVTPPRERRSVHVSLGPGSTKSPRPSTRALRAALRPLESEASVRVASEPIPPQSYSPMHGTTVRAPVGGFTQVNEAVNQELVQRVVSEVTRAGARRFLDIYCGSGNFALPLLHLGLSGIGVEQSVEAISAAQNEAKTCSLDGQFIARACDRYLLDLDAEARFDVVILDPPRAGARGVIPPLLRLRPALLLMIACDPVSLARDLGELVRGGYRIESVEGYDMFPHTHHVETLAILRVDESPRLSEPAL